MQPGRNYFIKINSAKSKDHFGCDISTDKKNFRLVLVKEGFAVPSKNAHKLLHEAYEEAVKNKKGMFSAKFESVTECILGEIPNFGDKKEEGSRRIITFTPKVTACIISTSQRSSLDRAAGYSLPSKPIPYCAKIL